MKIWDMDPEDTYVCKMLRFKRDFFLGKKYLFNLWGLVRSGKHKPAEHETRGSKGSTARREQDRMT